jgi:mercuric ion transport protein
MREMISSTSPSRSGLLSYLSLFTSFGTLLCCALPWLLVLLGLGATVASFLSAVPWLVMSSHHKNWVFGISGPLIAGNFVYIYVLAPRIQRHGTACASDGPDTCARASRTSRVVLWISVVLYCCGAFSAYLLGPMLMRSVYGN